MKQLVTEMTVKAGQKCTAIRRAFVPGEHLDAVAEAVIARLERVTVGNPANPDVRMGALAGLEQREEVRRSLQVADRRRARCCSGRRTHVDVDRRRRRARRVPLPGAAARPSPTAPRSHEVEAFGPVSTLVPYTSTAQVIELAARGQGSLAGSVVTGDPDFARDVVLGVAPWHGRLLVLDQADATTSTGHGSPMPQLVHGGPGRAGGGEEMGGIRGVAAPHAAHRDPGLAGHAHRDHRPLGAGIGAHDHRRPPVPQAPRGAARRRHRRRRARGR